MATYIEQLQQVNPEAYAQFANISKYAADTGYGGKVQDWMAQVFTPLDVSNTPRSLNVWEREPGYQYVADPEGGGGFQYVAGVPRANLPEGVKPIRVANSEGGFDIVEFEKDMGTINGLKLAAKYNVNGELKGFSPPSGENNKLPTGQKTFLNINYDVNGKPIPNEVNNVGKGMLSGLPEFARNAAALYLGAQGIGALTGAGAGAAGAGALTGVDAAMADLAASTPAFTGAGAAATGAGAGAGAGLLSGYDAAMADLATSAPAFGGAEVAAGGAGGLLAGNTDKAALYGDAGYGAGMTGAETAAYDTGLAAGAGAAGAATTTAAGGAGAALTASELAKSGLLTGGLSALGGALQGNTSQQALRDFAAQQQALAEKTMQMGKFQPVGVTTRFGTSSFTTDPVTGAITPSYAPTAEAKAYQDALAAMATQGLTAGQGLMNLGQQYVGESPEAVRQRYIQTQQALLAPQQEQSLAALRARQAATGRGGLATGATSDGMMATNPEMAAYYNSLAQTQRQLAANAETQYQNQVNFGTGLLNQASTPFANVFGAQKSVEAAAQQPLELSTNFANTVATRGAAQGANYASAMNPALQAQLQANNYNPYATALQGASSNPLTGYGLLKLTGLG